MRVSPKQGFGFPANGLVSGSVEEIVSRKRQNCLIGGEASSATVLLLRAVVIPYYYYWHNSRVLPTRNILVSVETP